MAWYDHEELKPLEDRSIRYKLSFYNQYCLSKRDMIYDLIFNYGITAQEVIEKLDPHTESELVSYAIAVERRRNGMIKLNLVKKPFESNKKNINKIGDTGNQKWVIDKNKTYEEGDQVQASDAINDRNGLRQEGLNIYKKNSKTLKFNEDQYLKEVQEYISSTYNQHYAKDQEVQSIEMIISAGHGEGFALGNISKLAARYGKKLGHNRQDLLKILHYGVLALHIHDKFYKEND